MPTSAEISAFATTVFLCVPWFPGRDVSRLFLRFRSLRVLKLGTFWVSLSFIDSLCFELVLFMAGTISLSAGYTMVLLGRHGPLAFVDAFSASRSSLDCACWVQLFLPEFVV